MSPPTDRPTGPLASHGDSYEGKRILSGSRTGYYFVFCLSVCFSSRFFVRSGATKIQKDDPLREREKQKSNAA
jgi:hypothetical protein